MDEQILNSVNAESDVNVEHQETEVNSESANTEVATVQNEKPTQSVEENAKYAAIRREAEQKAKETTQKAIDQEYSRLYGAEYGIHSKADYDKAIAQQQAEAERARIQEQIGIDPDNLKPLFEQWKQTDPDFQELSKTRTQRNIETALSNLNNELKDAGLELQLNDLSDAEVEKLPNLDKITSLVKNGHSLADAFFLANKKDIISKQAAKAEQLAIQKITANGASSPGSLASGGDSGVKTIHSMSKADFQRIQEEVLRGERKKL